MKKSFELEPMDPELTKVLSQFRASAHAWSAQEYARVSLEPPAVTGRRWKLPHRWMMAVCLVITAVSVPVHREQVRHAQQVEASMEAQKNAQFLVDVDADVSQRVPASMSPLASLIASDEPGSEQITSGTSRQGERQP